MKGGKNSGKGAQAAGRSRPVSSAAEAAQREPGVSPGARLAAPTGRPGLVRYTALTTARENARPALLGPGVFVGGETAAAQAARSVQASLRRVPFGGVVCEKRLRCLPSYLHQGGVNTEG